MNLLEAAEKMSKSEGLSMKDWTALSNGIGNLYANIFNKAGNTVNILNQQNMNETKLSMFKGAMRD